MSSHGNQDDLKRTRFSMELFVKLQSMSRTKAEVSSSAFAVVIKFLAKSESP
jgi:hypothetical protein